MGVAGADGGHAISRLRRRSESFGSQGHCTRLHACFNGFIQSTSGNELFTLVK